MRSIPYCLHWALTLNPSRTALGSACFAQGEDALKTRQRAERDSQGSEQPERKEEENTGGVLGAIGGFKLQTLAQSYSIW